MRERDHLQDLGIQWRIVLKWILSDRTGGWGGPD